MLLLLPLPLLLMLLQLLTCCYHFYFMPHLLPQSSNRVGGIFGAPARGPTKRRRASRDIEAQANIDITEENSPKGKEKEMIDVETPLGVPSGSATTSGGPSTSGYVVRRPTNFDDTDQEFVEGLKAMKSGMEHHMKLMTSFRDTDRLRARMDTIKLMLSHFPPGTPEHSKALEGLKAMPLDE
jgi:hypothetical protein